MMWSQTQINRVAIKALDQHNHINWLAAMVAQKNLKNYGRLSPENLAAIQQSWGEE